MIEYLNDIKDEKVRMSILEYTAQHEVSLYALRQCRTQKNKQLRDGLAKRLYVTYGERVMSFLPELLDIRSSELHSILKSGNKSARIYTDRWGRG